MVACAKLPKVIALPPEPNDSNNELPCVPVAGAANELLANVPKPPRGEPNVAGAPNDGDPNAVVCDEKLLLCVGDPNPVCAIDGPPAAKPPPPKLPLFCGCAPNVEFWDAELNTDVLAVAA